MPVYEYTALDHSGKKIKGSIDADNLRAARNRLRAQRIYPTTISEGKVATGANKRKDVLKFLEPTRIAARDLAVTTRQLATLIGSGMTLVDSLNALVEQSESSLSKRIFLDIREQVEEGSSFSKALGKFPKSFSRLYINMVASGEASGMLDTVLAKLADHIEAQLFLRAKIRSAMIYPILMLIVCTLVVLALFMFVIPQIVEIFERQNATLPLPTRIMIGISNFLLGYWYLLFIGVCLVWLGLFYYYRQPRGRSQIDWLILRLPLFGNLYLKSLTARLTLTLAALLSSGVQLLTALNITRKITNNIHINHALEEAEEGVRKGRSLAAELRRSRIFPSMVCHMVGVGEKSGELEQMLTRAGTAYEREVNVAVDGLTSLLEPLMMIVVGGIVLAIVLSVMLPMADLISVIQG